MLTIQCLAIATCFLVILAADSPSSPGPDSAPNMESAQEILTDMVGTWEGNCRTWFRPGELADESKVKGTIKTMVKGRFLRHIYEGSMKGKTRTGEETIVFNGMEKKFQVSWFDTFHMNYGLLFSEGQKVEKGFSVKGSYAMGPKAKAWGWRTEYTMSDKDHLTITAFNITPDGQEGKAVETIYVRSKSDGK